MKTSFARFGVILATAGLAATGLTACGDDGASGTVTGKEYHASSSHKSCSGKGSKRKCRTDHDEAQYVLKMSDGGECKVEQQQYNVTQVGQQYSCK